MEQPLINSVSMPVPASSIAAQTHSHRFFVSMAGLLLATVLVGFAPSFFLKAYFGTPPLPTYLQLHGVVLTAWFLLFFVQTSLIASHRTNLHRHLGVGGVLLAAAVVVVSSVTTIRSIPRLTSAGAPTQVILLAVSNSAPLVILFSILMVCGFSFRRRPETHKRLMLLSSICIIGPAVSRLPLVREMPFLNIVVLLPLLLTLPVHDRVLNGRVHRATLWGVLLIFVDFFPLTAALIFTNAGPGLVRLLGSVSL